MKRGVRELLRDQVRAAVELFVWWRAELRDVGQFLLRQLPSRKSPELLLRVLADSATVDQRDGQGWKVIGTVPARDDGSWPAELPGLPPEVRDSRTAIALPESELYFDEIELPLAAERHLASVLRLQLERRLPVPLDVLLIDHQVIARDKRRETLRVRTAVAHRERVESLRESVIRWGLAPVSAGVAGADGIVQFNLLRRRRDPIRWVPTSLDHRLLRYAGAGAAVLIALIGIQWARERATVNRETAELHAQAQKLAAQRAALATQAAPLIAVRAVAAYPAAPELLAKLSIAVPNSAWFSHIDLATPIDAPGVIKLTGSAASTDEIIAALRAMPGVGNVQASSIFNGEILGRAGVEITAEFQPVSAKAGVL